MTIRETERVAGNPQRMGSACVCGQLPEPATIPMGGDGLDARMLATLSMVRAHGGAPWWLYLGRCSACDQYWLVAEESRIYDVHLMTRLDPAAAQAIVDTAAWPGTFLTYERTLAFARQRVAAPFFYDGFAHGLQFTAEDLRAERADITPEEIGDLLGLGHDHARALCAKVWTHGCDPLPG